MNDDNDGTTLHESGGVGLQGLREAFEAFYKRDANDPTSADLLSTFSAGWNACSALAASPLSDGWLPIETAPHGRKLIVGYPNKLGNWRTVMACYYPSGVLLLEDEFSDCDDEGYAPEGWYEDCESQDTTARTDEAPTHWMPLPKPPTTEDRSQS